MTSPGRTLLVVDDDPAQRRMLADVLGGRGDRLVPAATAEEALPLLDTESPELVLLDMRMPGMGGLGFLRQLGDRDTVPPVVVMTAFAEVDEAVEAMKLGARDYLQKPLDLTLLEEVIDRHTGTRRESPSTPDLPEGTVFASPIMLSLLDELRRVARADVPVLLCGETGCGKEVLAELLHRWSDRAASQLSCVNVAAIPESLIEAELFGAMKGAYTGADHDRPGRIEQAAGGVLFLDEVGEMPLMAQPKLLRVLETGRVTRLGGDQERACDFRLVSATNRDLEDDVTEGRFRQDLYYRIAVITIEVPPLRERREEILPLARLFLRHATAEERQLSPATGELLRAWSWPGNIRELRNVILRAAILAAGNRILPEHLTPNIRESAGKRADRAQQGSLAEIERQAILDALDRCGGNRTRAAKELGISRRKLLYRLKEYQDRTA